MGVWLLYCEKYFIFYIKFHRKKAKHVLSILWFIASGTGMQTYSLDSDWVPNFFVINNLHTVEYNEWKSMK